MAAELAVAPSARAGEGRTNGQVRKTNPRRSTSTDSALVPFLDVTHAAARGRLIQNVGEELLATWAHTHLWHPRRPWLLIGATRAVAPPARTGEGRTSAIRAAALENAGSGLQHLDVVHVLADSKRVMLRALVLSIAAFSVIDHTDATFLRAEALETARVSAFRQPLLRAAMPSGLATAHPRRSRMRTQAAGKRPDSIYISVDHLSCCPFQ
ncbi:hypothetical protein K438DRAFT_1976199 [Mycena galopus ATCC 62051]|nr:hypothetical protein K438DRAFT_1976199 [Mycena galopus ATCC 62051]